MGNYSDILIKVVKLFREGARKKVKKERGERRGTWSNNEEGQLS